MSRSKKRQYDIALSFAGEDRQYAERLAALLNAVGCRTFYDKYEESNLVGKNLYQYLTEVYSDSAHFCVVFLSKKYTEKPWTKLELRAAQDRVFIDSHDYILPLRLDDTPVPGILETTGYLDLRKSSLEDAASAILIKLANLKGITPKLSLEDTIPNHATRKSFVKYCSNLCRLVKSANRLLITYVATGGSENLFFLEPAIKWFALQRELVENSNLKIERVLFIDGKAIKYDPTYRWMLRRIYEALSFTRPLLRVCAIDVSKNNQPIDLQIIQSKQKDDTLIIPNIVSSSTMHSEIRWQVIDANNDSNKLKKAHYIFNQYVELPDHSKYLAMDSAPKRIVPKMPVLSERISRL